MLHNYMIQRRIWYLTENIRQRMRKTRKLIKSCFSIENFTTIYCISFPQKCSNWLLYKITNTQKETFTL